jgi:hypothetical protein
MDKVKAIFGRPGTMRLITVAYILVIVALKAFHLDVLVGYISFVGPFMAADSPVSAADASAALLGAVSIVKMFVQWLGQPEPDPAPKA